jgi:Fe-S-cluster-containing hydrogenase component 2
VTGPSKTLSSSGLPEPSDIAAILPDEQRLRQGPVAIIECFQEIPCDPCSEACAHGAIRAFEHVCHLPAVDHALCNGCGLCVVRCPGLAIFVVDLSGEGSLATVKLAYEYLPLPQAGQEVMALDRRGAVLGPAKVLSCQRPRSFDRTALITLELPKEQAMAVRGIRPGREAAGPVREGGSRHVWA